MRWWDNGGAGGRKKGFTAKSIAGLEVWDAQRIAAYGDAAGSTGGKLAEACFTAAVGCKYSPGVASDAEQAALLKKLNRALIAHDSRLFREIADYLDARKKTLGNGRYASELDAWAAYFVGFCQPSGIDVRSLWTPAELIEAFHSRTLVAAWKRAPFTPTVREMHDFLCEIMAEAPDYKTTERAARRLGIAARPKKKK